MKGQIIKRRPLKSRQTPWAISLTHYLLKKGIKPNQVSLTSIVFAALAGLFLLCAGLGPEVIKIPFYLLTALCIQLRLLCNMLDGMLAIEGKIGSKTGELFNELPDRLSDIVILVCAGYATGGQQATMILGWLAALIALFTAYIRLLGISLQTQMYFNGPMAKPHRMSALTMGCFFAAAFTSFGWDRTTIAIALVVIVVGSVITCLRRLNLIVSEVKIR